ncbi:MAG: SulP family inorganic anion transporter [Parvularculaceae bacterium]|nr:SulP family inorganic anion transporter [Parvularculaceae bacterium]
MASGAQPSFSELFTPKLVTVLREGYGLDALRADAAAGLTVAVVALPLSMAIAIASGLPPANGLYAAVVGGFLVSALGGSRFQIGGPAGAFIVLVSATVARHGVDGMLAATMIAGVFLALAGFLRLGAYVRLIPYPVTLGFTAGIAVIIFASQLKDLLGLTLDAAEKGPIAEKLLQDGFALSTISPGAVALSLLTIVLIVTLKRARPRFPAILFAVVVATLIAAVFRLDVATIGSRFGGAPQGLPVFRLPSLSPEQIGAVLPDAFSFALLGAIESLLSATVADGMTGRRCRANCELVAQGAANIAAGMFGAMMVTGTIARTATNVRAGARGPVAGMLHAVALLLFLLIAGPAVAFIPLAALAGVLVVVARNMIEDRAIAALFGASRGDALAFAVTFLLTVFRDLTTAIVAGVAIGALAFLHRISQTAALFPGAFVDEDRADAPMGAREADGKDAGAAGVAVYRLSGALFFGSAASLGAALDRVLAGGRVFILDFAEARFVDTSGAHAVKVFVDKARRQGVDVILSGVDIETARALGGAGIAAPLVRFADSVESARALAGAAMASGDEAGDNRPTVQATREPTGDMR